MSDLAIKDVAEQTGIAAGTIRVWEQRYGFPAPERTASGYRRYSEEDVAVLRRVAGLREEGLSVPAALERARLASAGSGRPSLYGAILAGGPPVTPRVLRKKTLVAMSRAVEDETLARGVDPVVVGAFQREQNYRAVEHRYKRMAQTASASVVFADFGRLRTGGEGPAEVPIDTADAIGNEWAVVVDAPGFACALLAWEHPQVEAANGRLPDGERRFEALWTLEPATVRRAALAAAAIARRVDGDLGQRLEGILRERPPAVEAPSAALTAVCNRMIGYLDAAA